MTSLHDELEKKLQDPNATPMSLPLEFLKIITCDFSTESELGRGGYGVVYKGVLRSGKIIAVKKLFETLLKHEAFQNEISFLMGIKHQNVVQFVGYCAESKWEAIEQPSGSGRHILAEIQKRLLCFEYVSNKSLDTHIADRSLDLEWNIRYKIIIGICNGLHFLHEKCRIIHLDLKPENILMDSNMKPKIADFGLSRLFGEQQSKVFTDNRPGTRGYMAPEYINQGLITKNADIFSLGVIIIEIVTGHRDYPYFQLDSPESIATSCQHFTEEVLGNWRYKFESSVKYISMEKYSHQVKECITIALKCVDPVMEKRPTLKNVIQVLNAVDQGSQDYRDKDEKPIACEVSQNSSFEKISSSKRIAASDWMKNNPLIGRESEMDELHSHIYQAYNSDFGIVPVWGIAGIGKSALVRNMYNHIILHKYRFNKFSWVDVPHPFSLKHISQSLLSDYKSETDPMKECRELLSQHGSLVVIDDLQSKEEWDLIRAEWLSGPFASVIIVITTEASVARYCLGNGEQVYNVKGLDGTAAIDLFRTEIQRKNPSSALIRHNCAELEELVLKCGGFPKVIVSIASLLATQTVTLMDTVRLLNHKFMHQLETNPDYDILRGQFDWMYNYFHTWLDSLKPCIFYLSIFPRGHNIRRRRLVMRWIAEGYSRESEEESAVDKGENFFSKLLDLIIIQQIPQLVVFSDTRMVACQVNGFIREYIVSRRQENLVFELGPNCVLTTQGSWHHLIILQGWDRDRIVFARIDFSRLRSLTVFGKWESFFISESMRLLRVLDLEDSLGVKDGDLKTMVQRMPRLKFLSLRGCSEISCLPNSLGDLWKLQTLDVRHTSIVSLPARIGKLQKLQYIRAGTKVSASMQPASSRRLLKFRRGLVGVMVPRGIGKLTALHTLGVVNVGASEGSAIVEELKKLTQLRKLGVSGINKHNSKKFFFETSCLVYLESLLVQLDEDSQCCLDDISLPWENLQSLKLYGLQDKLPLRNPLRKLSKLDLEMDTLQKNGMEFLGHLSELCILRLQVKQLQPEDGKLHFHAEMYGEQLDTFKKVKILEVTCRSSRLNVIFGSKSMKNLELLKIDCSSASYNLSGLEHLSKLKEVLVNGTSDEEIKTHIESLLGNHPKSPTVKLMGLPRW